MPPSQASRAERRQKVMCDGDVHHWRTAFLRFLFSLLSFSFPLLPIFKQGVYLLSRPFPVCPFHTSSGVCHPPNSKCLPVIRDSSCVRSAFIG